MLCPNTLAWARHSAYDDELLQAEFPGGRPLCSQAAGVCQLVHKALSEKSTCPRRSCSISMI